MARPQARRRPNQRQIAQIVGVSQRAVSKALRGEPDVGERTRRRVLSVARALGYRPNRLIANIYRGRTKMLGAFMLGFGCPFFHEMLHGMEREAFDNGYSLVPVQAINDTPTDEYEISLLLQNRVDGLIACPRTKDRNKALYAEAPGTQTMALSSSSIHSPL